MLLYFTGEDQYQLRAEIANIAHSQKATIAWLDPDEAKHIPPQEWGGQAVSLFEKKIIVVRNVELLSAPVQEALLESAEALAKISATIILWESKATKNLKLKRGLKKYIQHFPALSEERLVLWLQKEAENRSTQLDRSAAEVLLQRVGSDRWLLLNELEKLALRYENITVEEVSQALPEQVETTIFAMLDNLTRGNQRGVVTSAEQLFESGAGELYILSMLAYQFRTLLSIRQGNVAELKSFTIQKNKPIASRFSSAQLIDILTRILATDFAIKQGTVEARTGVWLLITSLTTQMPQPQSFPSPRMGRG